MSPYNKEIEEMNFEELRAEVSSMRHELTKYKRLLDMYTEDMENSALGKSLTMENGKLRTQIKAVAGEISTKVEQIEEAKDSVIEKESSIKQTAEKIETIVKDSEEKISKIEQNVQGLRSYVARAAKLSEATEVSSTEERTDTDAIYVIRDKDNDGNVLSETYYYYDIATEDWETSSEETIYTVFEQTSTGFKLKGNVQIDGSCILTDSLTFNSSDRPLEVQYSADGETEESWHDTFDSSNDKFMRIKIGAQWSDVMKVVGSDGEQGPPGPEGETVDYGEVSKILENTYNIKKTSANSASIASPKIYTAEIYSPKIYGKELILETKNEDDNNIYNNLHLTPTGMSLVNSNSENAKEKFSIDLGDDKDNSTILMRLGAGVDASSNQGSLILEKYSTYIRIGTVVPGGNFAGMTIFPSTGALSFYGTTIEGLKVTFG